MRIVKKILLFILFLIFIVAGYLFVGSVKTADKIIWGVNFSQKYAGQLGLDWEKVYSALLDDMGTRNLKVAVHWDLLEPKNNEFFFDDLDWQISEAKKREAKIIPVIGMKTSRWPECHIPGWAKGLSKEEQQSEILALIKEVVSRYSASDNISAWQVENEPFFPFGDCPWVDTDFLKEEVLILRGADLGKRPVIISDSGEGSLWIQAAKIGDIVGTTLYKKVWFTFPSFLDKYLGKYHNIGLYVYYPFPPVFYGRKAEMISYFFHKKVICVEFQAEPWTNDFVADTSLKEQEKTMNLQRFRDNVEFAKKTGLPEFYLWGGEWMYWSKEKQGKQEIWDEAKKLFNN